MWGFTEQDLGARRRPANPFEREPSEAQDKCSEGRSRPDGWGSRPETTWGEDKQRIATQCAVRQLPITLSPAEVDQRSLSPAVWIAAHPEHDLQDRRDEAEATASARHRRRARPFALRSPLSNVLPSLYDGAILQLSCALRS